MTPRRGRALGGCSFADFDLACRGMTTRTDRVRMGAWLRALVSFIGALLIVALAPSPALAQSVLDLDCTPIAGLTAEKDPIVAVHVRVQRPDWRITHIAASGARYERNAQYRMHDATIANSLSWFGTLVERPYIEMGGRLVPHGDTFVYEEEVRDARMGGPPMIATRAQCAPARQSAQASPVAPSTPLVTPAAPSSPESLPRFSETQSSSFSVTAASHGGRWQIVVTGMIPSDAGSRLRAAVAEYGVDKHSADVVLNSSGGSLLGGLSLGRTIRDLRFNTVLETVTDRTTCYSACAYAFLGGVSRQIGLGKIGFHQFAPVAGGETDPSAGAQTSQQLMVAIDAYLADMGVSHDLLSVAANVGPSQIRVLTPQEADALRVNFDDQNSMIQWTLAAWPTGLVMRTESATGAREARLACATGGKVQLELRWNRNDFQTLPAKGSLAGADPKFTINGVDSVDATESIDDNATSLIIRFVVPVKVARSLIVPSYGSGDGHFTAGVSGDAARQMPGDLMMSLPTDNLATDLDVLIASCR